MSGNKPCEQTCSKCGSIDINRTFLEKDQVIHRTIGSDRKRKEDAFVKYDNYIITAKQECILHHCRTCQYEWADGVYQEVATEKPYVEPFKYPYQDPHKYPYTSPYENPYEYPWTCKKTGESPCTWETTDVKYPVYYGTSSFRNHGVCC